MKMKLERRRYVVFRLTSGTCLTTPQVAKELSKLSREERLKLRFQALLEEVAEEDLEDMEKYQFLQFIGQDEAGRTVVLFVVANAGVVSRFSFFLSLLTSFSYGIECVNCLPGAR